MACRCAPTLRQLVAETNEKYPLRSKASDGCCASAKHTSQNPTSDHEPDVNGIAHAEDLTHDPAHGFDGMEFVAMLVAREDHRVKYLIHAGQIWRSYRSRAAHPPAWTPDLYTGPNRHDHHVHVSVWTEHENDTSPWFLEEDDMPLSDADVEKVAKRVAALLLDPDHLGPVKHHIVGAAAEGARLARAVKILEAK